MRRWGERLIIRCFLRKCFVGIKNPKNRTKKIGKKNRKLDKRRKNLSTRRGTGEENRYWVVGWDKLWIRGLSTTSMSEVTKSIPRWYGSTLYLFCCLPCLDGHAFIWAVFLELLIWLLVKQNTRVKRLQLASLDVCYGRCWSIFSDIWLPIKASRYFFLLDNLSIKRGSRGLALGRLFFGHIPHYR